MAQDKTLSQGEWLDMDKDALIMESWTPLSASRQRGGNSMGRVKSLTQGLRK